MDFLDIKVGPRPSAGSSKGQLRKSLWDLFDQYSWRFDLTFAYNKSITLQDARKPIGVWLQRFDHTVLGQGYQRSPLDRAMLIGMFEHVKTNIHFHALFIPPLQRSMMTIDEVAGIGEKNWQFLMPSGDLKVQEIYKLGGAQKYKTKEVFAGDDLDKLLVWNEFWPANE